MSKKFINPIRLSKRTKIFLVIFYLAGGIGIYFWSQKYNEHLRKTYPLLREGEAFNGVIQSFFFSKGAVYLHFEDYRDMQLPCLLKNSVNSQMPLFCDFIKPGDSLVRKAYSDTIYVFKEGNRFSFIPAYSFPWVWAKD